MANIDWPAGLPEPRVGTFAESCVSAYADDKAEVGAGRRRKRFTRTLAKFSFDLVLNATQKALLVGFRDAVTDGAVLTFNWVHPSTGSIYEVRFSEPPGTKHVAVGTWTASVSLDEI
ncbi:hypothetical protein Hden_2965 [Hyphomicrobium denitrificans ATCC 51888]|uniref:Uncharacterized protein n=1 Tax=Hyphomicrobium denitrificans (strain ATCC 51888 / DSM 1869 / NCIMB 11706 / TK 0415) TaxID=582899 RepID=D8JVA6_HYPDA|nr:hypothetical protein [Hyphomicrobium denitrificans]ADJ24760.1 hypothetical protein Hden_2965 [Hyphomicrobium denitrificans ATCC 51888]